MNFKVQISNCRFWIVAAVALLCAPAFGQGLSGGAGYSGGAGFSAAAAAGGGSFQFLETFDNATDFDNAGWTKNNGGENPNYTTTILEGTQSLEMHSSGDYITRSQTAQDTTYYYFQLQVGALTSVIEPIWVLGGGLIARIGINTTTGTMYAQHGTIFSASTVTGISANTKYHVWLTYTKSTGANGFASVAFSTTGTRPTSGNQFTSLSNGDATAQATDIRLLNAGTISVIADRFIINNSQIGDNP